MESPKNSILRQLLRMACWGCLRDDIVVDYPGFNCINGLLAACHILTWDLIWIHLWRSFLQFQQDPDSFVRKNANSFKDATFPTLPRVVGGSWSVKSRHGTGFVEIFMRSCGILLWYQTWAKLSISSWLEKSEIRCHSTVERDDLPGQWY